MDRDVINAWVAVVATVVAAVCVGWWLDWRAGVALFALVQWADFR